MRRQAEQKCLESGSAGASPETQRPKLPAVALSDLLLDSYWGSVPRVSEAAQVLPAWFYSPALWNTCASESGGLGTIATWCDSSHTCGEKHIQKFLQVMDRKVLIVVLDANKEKKKPHWKYMFGL